VSYTYRTDKLLDAIGNAQGLVNQRNCPKQWVGFAIELETELQEATLEIERLRKSNLQLREGAEQQKQRIKRLDAGDAALTYSIGLDLQKENDVLKDRIKRLEEALRRIANADYRGNRSTESQIAFEALKEAKP
jgi:predicted nuclease with TOPRIM domain